MGRPVDSVPSISIVIPAYNAGGTIHRCMQSVLSLDPQLVEVIVIDDGSTDDTGEIVDRLVDGRHNCTVVHQQNAGRSRARNRGVSIAQSPWVTFLDADDVFVALPDLTFFDHEDYQSIWCGYLINGNNPVLPRLDTSPLPATKPTSLLLSLIVDTNSPQSCPNGGFDGALERSVWATFYSKRYLTALGGIFDPDLAYAEDLEFNVRFLRSTSRYLSLPLVTYDYREEDSGTMRSFNQKDLIDLIRFCDVIQHDLAGVRSPDEISPLIGNEVIHQIRRAGRYGTLADVRSVSSSIRKHDFLMNGIKAYSPPRIKHRLLAKTRLLLIRCHWDSGIRLMEQLLERMKKG